MADFEILTPEQRAEIFASDLNPSQPPRPTLTPATVAAVERASATLPAPDFALSESGREQGMRPGVPFDSSGGVRDFGDASLWDIMAASAMSKSPRAQASRLSEFMGLPIEAAPNGDFVARNVMDPKTGQVKDVLVNPRGLGMEDIGEFAMSLPVDIAEGALAVATRGALRNIPWRGAKPFENGIGSMAATGLAGVIAPTVREGIGGVKDILLNVYETGQEDIDEVKARRIRNLKWSSAFNIGGSMLGRAAQYASPFGGLRSAETAAASEAVKQAEKGGQVMMDGKLVTIKPTNVRIDLTPGEQTANPSLMRAERIVGQMPGGNVISDLQRERTAKLVQVAKAYVDGDVLPSPQMGEALERSALKTVDDAKVRVEKAREVLVKAAEADVKTVAGVTTVPRIPAADVGRGVRESIRGRYDAEKQAFNKRYDDFLNKPEIRNAVDVSGIVKPRIDAILADLPSFKKEVVEAVGGLTDEFGDVATSTKTVTQLFDRFVPPKLVAKLEQLSSAEKISVKALKELRTSIDDDIAEGIAIPGTSVKRLTELKSAVNQSIDEILAPNPGLKAEWDGLNKGYSAFKAPFSDRYIQRVMVPEGEPGGVGNTEIVYSLIGKSGSAVDAYNNLQSFFGKGSKEMQGIVQAVKEKLVDLAAPPGHDITVGAIMGMLDSLDGPITREIFSPEQINSLRDAARSLHGADKLDSNEVRALMRKNTLTGKALKELATQERGRALLVQNSIYGEAAKGVNAVDLSRFLLRPDANPREVGSFLRELRATDPETAEQFRAFATDDMIRRLYEFNGTAQALSPEKMVKFFKDADNRNLLDVYREAVGDETFYGLKRLSQGLEPSVDAMLKVGDAGGMAKSQEVARFQSDPPGVLKRSALRWFLTAAYTTPMVRKAITNRLMTPERVNRLIDGLLMSEPAIEYLVETAGESAVDIAKAAGWLANRRDRALDDQNSFQILTPDQKAAIFGGQNQVQTNTLPNQVNQVVLP